LDLEIKARSGTEEEKKYAAKLLPIIAHHHQLLVTLMLWNACATEALPIFLSALVPEYVAIIISVTLVLLLGDIIPSSVLSGPKQLQFTASLAPLVYFVLAIFSPLAYPIARGLDYMVGHSSSLTLYNRTEISALMRLHRELGQKRHASDGGHEDSLYEEEEVTIIAGALKYREMTVSQAMTPALQAYMISAADTLNYKLIYDIFKSGYSRIPVYGRDRNDIVGLILVQDLVFISPEVAALTSTDSTVVLLTFLLCTACRTQRQCGAF
jgi:metal transporter CNNM